MHRFPVPAAALVAVVLATITAAGSPFGASAVLVVLAFVAAALVAFNWWELWSSREDR